MERLPTTTQAFVLNVLAEPEAILVMTRAPCFDTRTAARYEARSADDCLAVQGPTVRALLWKGWIRSVHAAGSPMYSVTGHGKEALQRAIIHGKEGIAAIVYGKEGVAYE